MNSENSPARLSRYLPIFQWARVYSLPIAADDLIAAIIVTVMLVPQSLAYAMLANLPPQVGLYASIFPLLAYALLGTSRTLAIGPVAVVSLMTAAALGQLDFPSAADYAVAALVLALLSGLFLLVLGILRLGFLANFLSHPVISGFITASGILIAASQARHILGVEASGQTLYEILASLGENISRTNPVTLGIGGAVLVFLFAVRTWLKSALVRLGLTPHFADITAKLAPIVSVVATTAVAAAYQLPEQGLRVVGIVPQGLPPFTVPTFDMGLWLQLIGPAILLSIIGFVESVSVAQTLAAKRRERIDPNQELIALGGANISAAFSGGYPVTGGFARSVVNFDSGARTPAAAAFTAVGIALAALFLTPHIYFLPQATLAATIIVAVLSLVDLGALRRTWNYSKKDFAAMAVTIAITLAIGVEAGVSAGVALSIALFLYRTSRPHVAIVGLVPGSEHFRNVLRHEVKTSPHILSMRVDESLYFANARFLEDKIYDMVAANPAIRHVVLMCTAVNEIDASALESLDAINSRLKDLGVQFHLSEVKGPVMDQLKRSDFSKHLSGRIFFTQYDAMKSLDAGAL